MLDNVREDWPEAQPARLSGILRATPSRGLPRWPLVIVPDGAFHSCSISRTEVVRPSFSRTRISRRWPEDAAAQSFSDAEMDFSTRTLALACSCGSVRGRSDPGADKSKAMNASIATMCSPAG
jgi:hypothetical protein